MNIIKFGLTRYFSASMLCDLPNKIGTATVFNLALYFMTDLRRIPGHFFVFYLFTFMCTLTISMYFRSIAALSRTLSQVGLFRWDNILLHPSS